MIIQEYIDGPIYSIEVFGFEGNFTAIQPTKIEIDSEFDCKRVLAPAELTQILNDNLKELGIKIADAVDLNGIMDV